MQADTDERPEGDVEARASALVEYLRGTCNAMPSWVQEDPDETFLTDAVDDELFLCSGCGWWCEQSEANAAPEDGDGDVCQDCVE